LTAKAKRVTATDHAFNVGQLVGARGGPFS